MLTDWCLLPILSEKKNSWIQAYFCNPDCSASTPMGDSRRHALRHNMVVTKPPQGHPASCPPPKEQHPHIQSWDPTPIESPGTPGPCHCTGDLRQVTDLPAPSSEGGEAKLGSSVPKGKGVTVSPIHSMMGRGPLPPPLSPSLLGRPQVSQEWRLLEGDSGLAPVEAHQDILSLPFRT